MILIVVVAGILAGALRGNGTSTYHIGVQGPAAQAVAAQAKAAAPSAKAKIDVVPISSASQARSRLNAGSLDTALLPGGQMLTPSSPEPALEQLLQGAARQVRGADVPPPLAVQSVSSRQQRDKGLATAAAFLLYAQLITYGLWVASGVVEEKSSRVIEVLLSKVRPRALLIGKVVGLGLLGLAQLLVTSVLGLVAAGASGAVQLSASSLLTLVVVLLWFLFGFAMYAWLYAMAGVIVSRQEDLQSSTTPLTVLVVLAFVIVFPALKHPAGTLAGVASLVPLSSPLIMPSRVVLGQASIVQAVISLALLAGVTALLIPLTVRIYEGAILRTGRPMKMIAAWRAARA